MADLSISVEAMDKLWFKTAEYGIEITVKDWTHEPLDGRIKLTFINTEENIGHLSLRFTDHFPHIAVYETDGKTISLGFGTSLNEGIGAHITMSDEEALVLIEKINRQLAKGGNRLNDDRKKPLA